MNPSPITEQESKNQQYSSPSDINNCIKNTSILSPRMVQSVSPTISPMDNKNQGQPLSTYRSSTAPPPQIQIQPLDQNSLRQQTKQLHGQLRPQQPDFYPPYKTPYRHPQLKQKSYQQDRTSQSVIKRHQFSSSTQNVPSLKLDQSKRRSSPSLSHSSHKKSTNTGPSDSALIAKRPTNVVEDSMRFAVASYSKPDEIQRKKLEEQSCQASLEAGKAQLSQMQNKIEYEGKGSRISPSRHHSYPSMGMENASSFNFGQNQQLTDNIITSSSKSPVKPYLNEYASQINQDADCNPSPSTSQLQQEYQSSNRRQPNSAHFRQKLQESLLRNQNQDSRGYRQHSPVSHNGEEYQQVKQINENRFPRVQSGINSKNLPIHHYEEQSPLGLGQESSTLNSNRVVDRKSYSIDNSRKIDQYQHGEMIMMMKGHHHPHHMQQSGIEQAAQHYPNQFQQANAVFYDQQSPGLQNGQYNEIVKNLSPQQFGMLQQQRYVGSDGEEIYDESDDFNYQQQQMLSQKQMFHAQARLRDNLAKTQMAELQSHQEIKQRIEQIQAMQSGVGEQQEAIIQRQKDYIENQKINKFKLESLDKQTLQSKNTLGTSVEKTEFLMQKIDKIFQEFKAQNIENLQMKHELKHSVVIDQRTKGFLQSSLNLIKKQFEKKVMVIILQNRNLKQQLDKTQEYHQQQLHKIREQLKVYVHRDIQMNSQLDHTKKMIIEFDQIKRRQREIKQKEIQLGYLQSRLLKQDERIARQAKQLKLDQIESRKQLVQERKDLERERMYNYKEIDLKMRQLLQIHQGIVEQEKVKELIAKRMLNSIGQYNLEYPLITAAKIRDIENQLKYSSALNQMNDQPVVEGQEQKQGDQHSEHSLQFDQSLNKSSRIITPNASNASTKTKATPQIKPFNFKKDYKQIGFGKYRDFNKLSTVAVFGGFFAISIAVNLLFRVMGL